jgi:carboxypeptidase Q
MKAANVYISVGIVILLVLVSSACAQEPVYWDVVEKITKEGFENSQVLETASWLTDVFGPRNANTPAYREAAEWARERLEEFGLSNAVLEPFEFGMGWEKEFSSVHMLTPQYMPVIALPSPWSAGTDGKVRARVILVNFDQIDSEADLDRYRGKLKNTIVFTMPEQKVSPHFDHIADRFTDEQLDKMAEIPVGPRVAARPRRRRDDGDKLTSNQKIEFVFAEGALAIAHPDGLKNGYGIIAAGIEGYALENRLWEKNSLPPITELVVLAEHYNRIIRIMDKGIPVEMEVEIRVKLFDDDLTDYNVIAELPGTDLADEIVMFGGHLQADPAGTGAIDDAAGVSVSMEALRILKAIGVEPRRTIRVALWGAHEMGNFGSRNYVLDHFGDPETQVYKSEHSQLSVYFNTDHGTGRFRGLFLQGNEKVRPIFTEWLKPLHSLGMKYLIPELVGSEDRRFSAVGLPGFSFLQELFDLDNRNAHTTMDVFDRLIPEDLMQSAVVMASIVYHAAMRDEKLPRIAPMPVR